MFEVFDRRLLSLQRKTSCLWIKYQDTLRRITIAGDSSEMNWGFLWILVQNVHADRMIIADGQGALHSWRGGGRHKVVARGVKLDFFTIEECLPEVHSILSV